MIFGVHHYSLERLAFRVRVHHLFKEFKESSLARMTTFFRVRSIRVLAVQFALDFLIEEVKRLSIRWYLM